MLLLVLGAHFGQASLARASAPERWLFIPVFAGERPNGADPSALTEPLEAALRGAGYAVVANAAAATTFENQVSAEPAQLGNDDLKRLSQSVARATRHLALGELSDAQRAMEGVNALSGPARDYLNRDTKRARKIFDNCVMASYLLERVQQHQPALHQMLECTRGFPSFEPEGRAYPAEVRRLFDEARREQSQPQPASLRVLSPSKNACGVRLHGVDIGRSPVQLAQVRSGEARVQLECEAGVVGRIHKLELKPGENELSIDPAFDKAMRSQGALWLTYESERERDQRAANDARVIAQALGIVRVVMLLVVPSSFGNDVLVRPAGTVPNRDLARVSYAADSGYPRDAASKVASALAAWTRPQPKAAGATSPTAALNRKRWPPPAGEIGEFAPPATGAPAAPAPVPPAAAIPAAAVPAPPAEPRAHYTQQHAAAGALLTILGAASTAVSWVFYIERQSTRRDLMGEDDVTKYQKLGVVALTTAGLGMTLLSVSEYFWLPDEPAIPALAWVAAAAGAAIGATAIALAFTESDCSIGDNRVSCQRFWSDRQFAPFLFLHALPFLTVPLWYALRIAVRPPDVQITLNANREGLPSLALRAKF